MGGISTVILRTARRLTEVFGAFVGINEEGQKSKPTSVPESFGR